MGVFQTEGNHAGGFIVSEESIDYRKVLLVGIVGAAIAAGTVLGTQIQTPGVAVAGASNVGDGVMGAVVVDAAGGAMVGDYILTVTSASANAGDFTVKDPSGAIVNTGTVAVAFATGGLAFTLADGATDFAVGDVFVITVSGEQLPVDLAAVDGSQIASGVLFDNIDTTAAAAEAVVLNKDCVLNGQEIVLPSGITTAETNVLVQQLADIGVVVKGA